MKKADYKNGFTLAEVLITLGIIGIIAAMTLPSLIGNYKRKVVVNRLKKTYSVLSQAFERTRADYGDPSGWDIGGYMESISNNETVTKNFSKIYIIPYLAKIKNPVYSTWKDYGYKYIKIFNSWTTEQNLNRAGQMLALNDGTILQITAATHNYGTEENRDDRIVSIMIWADINGLKSPNESGKDIFAFRIMFTDGRFGFYDTDYSQNQSTERKVLLNKCKNTPYTCGLLIMADNWEIKEDYPWQ